jgi:hypothetical protein
MFAMLTKELQVEIDVLHRQGKGIREIARDAGVSRNTVRAVLRGEHDGQYGPRMPANARPILSAAGDEADRLFAYIVQLDLGLVGDKIDLRVGLPICNLGSAFSKRANLLGDNGKLLHLSMRRLRRTQQVRSRKAAQNSQETHDNTYVLADRNARASSAAIAERGLKGAVAHAQRTVKMRWEAIEQEQSLATSTPSADCDDFHNGPFAPKGDACTASFLMCFACENASASRRHLPRLVVLRDALARRRSIVSERVWERQWLPHWQRVHNLLSADV